MIALAFLSSSVGCTVLKGSMLVLSHLRRSRKPRLVPLRGVQTYLQVTQMSKSMVAALLALVFCFPHRTSELLK